MPCQCREGWIREAHPDKRWAHGREVALSIH